ncbi:MAG: cupin domain-containing protein [Anaeromyxobacter sp.]
MSEIAKPPIALHATAVPGRAGARLLPEPFASRLSRRVKHALGDAFGLRAFGVNLTRIPAGDVSALHHRHSVQDEWVYVLEGRPTLVTDAGEVELAPGMCAGFPAGGTAHHLENRTAQDVVVLEVGDRAAGDRVTYPGEDLALDFGPDGRPRITHRDGTPY